VDRNIIKHINRGEKKAFKEVFDQYFHSLAAFGFKYVSDQFVAEDLVQEVFISMWEKREDFSHINALKSFLYTAVRNKCLNHIKHQSVVQKHEKALSYELESEQNYIGHVIEEETFNQLFQEIKNLPPSAQEITLLALNGLKNQEIADELNISVNTVKTQKKIAYSRLKENLGSHFTGILLYLLFV
jgi:RNA polymerase sigma-70 factor (ECF subfamily)